MVPLGAVRLCATALICGAVIGYAQTYSTSISNAGQSVPAATGASPFSGSVPGKLIPGRMPLSLQDAITLGLKNNLGLLLSSADTRAARGQRWQELSALLPHVAADPYIADSKINLAQVGLGNAAANVFHISPSVGPFSYFDARAAFSQSLFDWKSISAARAASANVKAADYTLLDAHDLVVLAVGYAYFQAVADEARIATGKAACLAAWIQRRPAGVTIEQLRFQPDRVAELRDLQIEAPWTPLTRLKGGNAPAFHFWYQAQRILMGK